MLRQTGLLATQNSCVAPYKQQEPIEVNVVYCSAHNNVVMTWIAQQAAAHHRQYHNVSCRCLQTSVMMMICHYRVHEEEEGLSALLYLARLSAVAVFCQEKCQLVASSLLCYCEHPTTGHCVLVESTFASIKCTACLFRRCCLARKLLQDPPNLAQHGTYEF